MKARFSKRFIAYILDILIVMVVSSFIVGFIPSSEKVDSLNEKLYEISNNITEQKISAKKYYSEVNSLSYEISHETVLQNVIVISVYLLYFVVFPMYNNGQTLGKKIAKIKITSAVNKDVSMNEMLLRSLILYGIAKDFFLVLIILFVKKTTYVNISFIINIFHEMIIIIMLLMIIIRSDGRGLHDILGKTKVIEEE